jgi:hypothetical protein
MINHLDADVRDVAAALGDAALAGGLSDGYHRAAEKALGRLAARLDLHRDLIERTKAVGHAASCPAVVRLQPDRVTMAAHGPCDCWHASLAATLAELEAT